MHTVLQTGYGSAETHGQLVLNHDRFCSSLVVEIVVLTTNQLQPGNVQKTNPAYHTTTQSLSLYIMVAHKDVLCSKIVAQKLSNRFLCYFVVSLLKHICFRVACWHWSTGNLSHHHWTKSFTAMFNYSKNTLHLINHNKSQGTGIEELT